HAARLALFRGDATEARRYVSEAEALAPNDEEIRALADAIFIGQAGLDARAEIYPSGYPSVYTYGGAVLQRWRRFEFGLDSHVVQRSGGGTSIIDVRNTLGVGYHPGVGVLAGLELGYGINAVAIPRYAMKLSFSSTIAWRFTGSFAYSLWA